MCVHGLGAKGKGVDTESKQSYHADGSLDPNP